MSESIFYELRQLSTRKSTNINKHYLQVEHVYSYFLDERLNTLGN